MIYALSTLASFLLLLVFTFIGYHMQIWEKVAVAVMAALSTLLLLPPEVLEMVLPVAAASQGVVQVAEAVFV